jgi:hypothetical protein
VPISAVGRGAQAVLNSPVTRFVGRAGAVLGTGLEAANTAHDVNTAGMNGLDQAGRVAEGVGRVAAAGAGGLKGAAWGTAIAPGVGTILGGLAGGALGAFAPNIANAAYNAATGLWEYAKGNNFQMGTNQLPSERAQQLRAQGAPAAPAKPETLGFPLMAAKWGAMKTMAALTQASKQAAMHLNDLSKVLQGEELAAYGQAVKEGHIDVTLAHDLAGVASGSDSGLKAYLHPAMKWASFLFHHAELFNRQVAFLAGLRLARAAGAAPQEAYAQAVDMTYAGHFDYATSNRPRVMQGDVARVVLQFKQYSQNMVYNLGRQAYLGVKAATPAERSQARKAFTGLLAMNVLAAGAYGLPVVGTLMAAASMLGGGADEPWDAKVALQNWFADIFGQKPAEVAAHGLSRLTPWDISGRIGMDRLLFPDVNEGLTALGTVESWL